MTTARISSAGLDIANLGKTYNGAREPAVANVSIHIEPGEIFAIVGPSGSGKSTILRMIAGLEACSEGSTTCLACDGTPARLVYVFQDYSRSLLPWRTVLANVALALEAQPEFTRKSALAAARPYLADVGLADVADRYPWELSGGMQQRVAIARALAARPDVLLLDEPFGALDALTRMDLQDLLLKVWSSTGLTIVLVTHDVDEAVYLSDRIAVLLRDPGRLSRVYCTELPRPRSTVATREDPQFIARRHDVLENVLVAAGATP